MKFIGASCRLNSETGNGGRGEDAVLMHMCCMYNAKACLRLHGSNV